MEDTLEVYADGACRTNPGPGGIGFRFVYPDENGEEKTIDLSPAGYREASIGEMELQACIVALEEAQDLSLHFPVHKIVLYSDATYVVNGIAPAQTSWINSGWYTSDGTPVSNVELWKKLTKAITQARANGVRVDLKWPSSKRHNRHVRAADRLAKASARNPLNPPLSVRSTGRRLSPIRTERGNVTIRNQRTTIHVISCDPMNEQGLWRLRYEIVSRSSPDRWRPDTIYSSELLKDRHCYRVKLGRNKRGHAQIEKTYREVDCPKKAGSGRKKAGSPDTP